MKKIFKYINLLLIVVFLLSSIIYGYGQVICDSIALITNSYLQTDKDKSINRVFISDGQEYRAFLTDDDVAEFEMTFYEGSTYRVATSAGVDDNYLIFELYDSERNLLFSNEEYQYSPYWDFKIEQTIDCTLEVRLRVDKKSSGCASILVGFDKKK